MATNILENISASLLNFCKRFGENVELQGITPQSLSPWDFDTVQDENELPTEDLIGISNLSITADEHILEVECLIGITTYDDTNGMRLKKLMGYLFEGLKPTSVLPYLDAETGVRSNLMSILNGTRLMPVTGGVRPARFIIVRLKSLEMQELKSIPPL